MPVTTNQARGSTAYSLVISSSADGPRADTDFSFVNPPKHVHFLQRSIGARENDNGKFAVAMKFAADDVWRFMTPTTENDRLFWANGLDGVESVSECIALFPTLADAAKMIEKYRRYAASRYRLSLEGSYAKLIFVDEEIPHD